MSTRRQWHARTYARTPFTTIRPTSVFTICMRVCMKNVILMHPSRLFKQRKLPYTCMCPAKDSHTQLAQKKTNVVIITGQTGFSRVQDSNIKAGHATEFPHAITLGRHECVCDVPLLTSSSPSVRYPSPNYNRMHATTSTRKRGCTRVVKSNMCTANVGHILIIFDGVSMLESDPFTVTGFGQCDR